MTATLIIKKSVKAFLLIFVFIWLFSLLQNDLLSHDKIWLMIAIVILASIFQPDYSPFKQAEDENDKGTALQIIWSVYLSQAAILADVVLVNYEHAVQWSGYAIAAAIAAIAGLLLRSWAFNELGRFFTWHISVEKSQTVIDTGPYRLMAHPGYTGALLTYVTTGVMFHAWYGSLFSVIILSFAFVRRIKYEEALLISELGNDYKHFLQSRYKLVPFIY